MSFCVRVMYWLDHLREECISAVNHGVTIHGAVCLWLDSHLKLALQGGLKIKHQPYALNY